MKMNKHESYDLAQMQSLSLDSKIRMTQERIKAWYEYYDGHVYVSVAGKDSTVLKHIIDSMYTDVPAVFVNTGLEYPEITRFWLNVKKGNFDCFNTDVTFLHPKKRFDAVIKEIGYPVISKEIAHKMHDYQSAKTKGHASYVEKQFNGTYVSKNGKTCYSVTKWAKLVDAPFKISHKCCDIMKKQPCKSYEKLTGRYAYVGTLAEDSLLRKQNWVIHGCNAFDLKRPQSRPLSFWTNQDILKYIKIYNVPFSEAYGEIKETDNGLVTTKCSHTGCMFCLFGCHLNDDQRFVNMKSTHPKHYAYCMKDVEHDGLGLKCVIDWLNENVNTNIKY